MKHFLQNDIEQVKASKRAYQKLHSEAVHVEEKFCQVSFVGWCIAIVKTSCCHCDFMLSVAMVFLILCYVQCKRYEAGVLNEVRHQLAIWLSVHGLCPVTTRLDAAHHAHKGTLWMGLFGTWKLIMI